VGSTRLTTRHGEHARSLSLNDMLNQRRRLVGTLHVSISQSLLVAGLMSRWVKPRKAPTVRFIVHVPASNIFFLPYLTADSVHTTATLPHMTIVNSLFELHLLGSACFLCSGRFA
jgi:hypothetical protein